MDTQDKDFDDLFRAKLDGFETEPSANVWPGIAGGLDSAKRRRGLAPWLSIAASIVVLTGVGLFFIPKKTNTNVKPPVKSTNTTAGTLKPTSAIQMPAVQPVKPSQVKAHTDKLKGSNEIARVPNGSSAIDSHVKNMDTTSAPAKALKRDEQQLVADVAQKPGGITKPVVPETTIQQAVKQAVDQLPGTALKPDKLASQDVTDTKLDSTLVKRRHKIHNFGDLVNLVVDKLDKREDKVIQFADDEDGDSHLTGVNLGIVRIKKGE